MARTCYHHGPTSRELKPYGPDGAMVCLRCHYDPERRRNVYDPDAEQPGPEEPNSELRSEIKAALNRHSAENGSNTPDHVLADYLLACLAAYDAAVVARARWFGRIDKPGRGSVPFPQGSQT